MLSERGKKQAARMSARDPRAAGVYQALRKLEEEIGGGADKWDVRPVCEGLAFEIDIIELPSSLGLGDGFALAVSDNVELSVHIQHLSGTRCRQITTEAVALAAQEAAVTGKIPGHRRPEMGQTYAMGFMSEGWTLPETPDIEQRYRRNAHRGRWVEEEPDRIEMRFAWAVDVNGHGYGAVRHRGEDVCDMFVPAAHSIGGSASGLMHGLKMLTRVAARGPVVSPN